MKTYVFHGFWMCLVPLLRHTKKDHQLSLPDLFEVTKEEALQGFAATRSLEMNNHTLEGPK